MREDLTFEQCIKNHIDTVETNPEIATIAMVRCTHEGWQVFLLFDEISNHYKLPEDNINAEDIKQAYINNQLDEDIILTSPPSRILHEQLDLNTPERFELLKDNGFNLGQEYSRFLYTHYSYLEKIDLSTNGTWATLEELEILPMDEIMRKLAHYAIKYHMDT